MDQLVCMIVCVYLRVMLVVFVCSSITHTRTISRCIQQWHIEYLEAAHVIAVAGLTFDWSEITIISEINK